MLSTGAHMSSFSSDTSTDTRTTKPDDPPRGLGICLSGGGYRAMLFHLGTILRLNELGLLHGAARISSVSGGSITSAMLGLRWRSIVWNQTPRGKVATNLGTLLVDPIRSLASTTIDVIPTFLGALPGVSAADMIASKYRKHLFSDATLQSLPDHGAPIDSQDRGPRFIINATNIKTGVLWRFSRNYMADYTIGKSSRPTVPLSIAVAASSAFPPILSPVVLSLAGLTWDADDTAAVNQSHRDEAVLTDGGVYDNLGLEPVVKNCRTVFVSDAGDGAERWDEGAAKHYLAQLTRVFWIQRQQAAARRRIELMDRFRHASDSEADEYWRRGAFWAITTDPSKFTAPGCLPIDPARLNELRAVKVRLCSLNDATQEGLINLAYALCDAAVRTHFDSTLTPPAAYPYSRGV